MLSPEDKIEEAHGIWELAVARLAGVVEAAMGQHAKVRKDTVNKALQEERAAFLNWQCVSRESGA